MTRTRPTCASSSHADAREREIMARVTAGLMNKQVAAEIGMSREHREGPPSQRDEENRSEIARPTGANLRPSGHSSCRTVAPTTLV